jgi:hypothetical protein
MSSHSQPCAIRASRAAVSAAQIRVRLQRRARDDLAQTISHHQPRRLRSWLQRLGSVSLSHGASIAREGGLDASIPCACVHVASRATTAVKMDELRRTLKGARCHPTRTDRVTADSDQTSLPLSPNLHRKGAKRRTQIRERPEPRVRPRRRVRIRCSLAGFLRLKALARMIS